MCRNDTIGLPFKQLPAITHPTGGSELENGRKSETTVKLFDGETVLLSAVCLIFLAAQICRCILARSAVRSYIFSRNHHHHHRFKI